MNDGGRVADTFSGFEWLAEHKEKGESDDKENDGSRHASAWRS